MKYKIRIHPDYMWKAKKELKIWGQVAFTIQDDCILTDSTNVVDVITETFMNHEDLYKIEEE